MSTRSIVAAEYPDGSVKGVYVHSDGYPDGDWGMLNQLRTKIARDGREKVVRTILGKPNGWSSLIPRDELLPGHTDGRFLLIKGYGTQYSRKLMPGFGKGYRQGSDEYLTQEASEAYFYVIRLDGLVVWTEGAGDTGPWYLGEDYVTQRGYPTYDSVPAPLDLPENTWLHLEADVIKALAERGGVKLDDMASALITLSERIAVAVAKCKSQRASS